MMKSQKKKADRFSFKFSNEDTLNQEDRTKKSLEQLARLDKISQKVSSTKIVEDISKKKRQAVKGQSLTASESKKKEEDKSSILLTEEEVASLEKAYFLHSKQKSKAKDDWD